MGAKKKSTAHQYIDEDYKKKFFKFIDDSETPITADYLLVCGDISCEATVDEIRLSAEIIKQITEKLKAKEVFFVPGNHDKDWTLAEKNGDSGKFWMRYSYEPLRTIGGILASSIRNAKGNTLEHPFYSVWERDNIIVAGINSAFHDQKNEKVHYGFYSQDILDKLDKELSLTNLEGKIKIFMLHHHPSNFNEPIPDDVDHSVMQNAENIKAVIEKHKFDMVVHGHKHLPKVEIMTRSSGVPLVYLCSGSFSAKIDTRYSGKVKNTFHIIEIDGRCSSSGLLRGRVRSWSYSTIDKWYPSVKGEDYIDHAVRFGCSIDRAQVKNIFKHTITDKFSTNAVIKLNTICNTVSDLTYVNNDMAESVVQELAMELGFTYVQNSGDPLIIKDIL